jgi:protein-tyrosine phosphatase
MIDLHSHLLPGIDDGPDSLDDSLAMARGAVESGIVTMLATPHVNSRYRNDAATIEEALGEVREALAREQIPLEVLAGAEIAVTYLAETDTTNLSQLALGSSAWLLIEPPFAPVARELVPTIQGLLWDGHRVILAHPERCPAIHRDRSIVPRLVEEGVLMSLTAGSLAGRFGSQARRVAVALLREELAHNVASDAHDERNRPPAIAAEIEEAGFGALREWLTEEVPGAILDGSAIPPRPLPQRGRRRLSRLAGAWPLRR